MDRKERIVLYMKSKEYIPLMKQELAAVLCVPSEDLKAFSAVMEELEREGRVILTKKGRYVAAENADGIVTGRLRCNGRGFFAFLICDAEAQEDIYINGKSLAGAINNDRVAVHVDRTDTRTGRMEGHVTKILERGNENLTGILKDRRRDGYYRVKCDNESIYTKIRIPEDAVMDAEIGQRVVVRLTKYDGDHIYGRIVKVLGDADSISGNVEAILFGHALRQEFPDEVIREAEAAPQEVSEKEIVGRLDLRDKIIFTIDGDDARDFDDAVSLDPLENGNCRLGVHIADVTHYVRENSPLDKEAFLRGTSVYLADRVIPMLPKLLSNGICSLNPHVDRLTLSVFMEIDAQGNIVSHDLVKSVIRSVERMTYHDVTKLIEGTDEALARKYSAILPTIKQMAATAQLLYTRRCARGSIDFDFPESSIIMNEQNEPIDIIRAERGISNRLIEEFMLAANETIAEYAFWAELPFVFRVHEPPDAAKIEEFNAFIQNFGYHLKGKFNADNPIHPKELQKLLKEIKDTPEEQMIASYMLRSLMKARYAPQNLGHFGLAAKYYTHFTSPIRRYPDLAIHRILKEFLDGKTDDTRVRELKEFTLQVSEQSSECEITAEYAERDVEALMKAIYMSQFIGDSFPGTISGVTRFGMFVELENSVEGLVRMEHLKDDYYDYDEQQRRLIGQRTNQTYKIGDQVEVTLIRTDLLSRQIDFILTKDAAPETIAAARKKEVRRRREKERVVSRLTGEKEQRSRRYARNIKNHRRKRTRKRNGAI